ncbi:CocE/NonD family hydrolase [Paenibacillus sinopodophylli]|uniref:CocE/NonD family hydrolase n=1 Tax=Paenibacillus sinopodophylli TaxID=1837342 RepID=UPI001FE995AE|nr:CocE/NonD family hydrolase [Paenibacillus sinopodophylli]
MDEQMMKQMFGQISERIEMELPTPTHEFGYHEDVLVEMSDDVKLKTRVFFPKGDGPWPVILMRNPYFGVKALSEFQLPWFTKYGYVGVYQQVRGTLDSEGEWLPFENERRDGLDTVNWIVKQSWMNGNIGTFGGSYLGHVQWSIADQVPPEVKTMYFSIYGGEPYDLFYMNGMFKQDLWTKWAVEMRPGGNDNLTPVEKSEEAMHVNPHIEMDQQLFGQELPWYRNWITNPGPGSAYWNTGFWSEFKEVAGKVNIPILFQGGWFDFFLKSGINSFQNLPEKTRKESRFIIGPWHHANMPAGELDYPNESVLGMFQIKSALEWFDHHLKGNSYPHRKGVAETYVIGEGVWKNWEDWIQPTGTRKLFLKASNKTNSQIGILDNQNSEQSESISYKYDPNAPVPSKGGANIYANPADPNGAASVCSVVQDEPATRKDVITFISAPLEEDLRIAGSIKVRLSVSSDAEDTAFTAKVMEIFPDGKAYNIQDSISTLAYRNGALQPLDYCPGELVEVDLELLSTTWTVKRGSRIRLDVSSSNFPAFHVHPNVSGIWSLQQEKKIAEQTLHIGGVCPSYVEIPYSDS